MIVIPAKAGIHIHELSLLPDGKEKTDVKMNEDYRLVKPIETEYEWNKGPRPSGFAKINVRLCPASSSAEGPGTVTIHADLEKIGKIRDYPYREKPSEDELQKYIPKGTQMAMSGIQSGCVEALRESLDCPVTNVEIIVEEIVFDPVFSTQKAFYFASRFTISQLLQKAKLEGLLK